MRCLSNWNATGARQCADGAILEAHADRVTQIDFQVEVFHKGSHLAWNEVRQPQQQRGGVRHLEMRLTTPGDGRLAVRIWLRACQRPVENVGVRLWIGAVILED